MKNIIASYIDLSSLNLTYIQVSTEFIPTFKNICLRLSIHHTSVWYIRLSAKDTLL